MMRAIVQSSYQQWKEIAYLKKKRSHVPALLLLCHTLAETLERV